MSCTITSSIVRCVVVTIIALTTAGAVAAQDSMAAARDLYAAAAYEDALAALERLRAASHSAVESPVIDQYRAFCLLALGRESDAVRAIEAVVSTEPSYHPFEADMSPRVRSTFKEVRQRMLPGIIQQKYAQAKAAFDRKEYAVASAGFNQVLDVLADADVAAAAKQPPLADLWTLAVGFRDLSVAGSAPRPALPPVAAAPPPPPKIYAVGDPGVVPPAALRQSLPSYPRDVTSAGQGILDVVIDETGAVETVSMRGSVNAAYDAVVLATAKEWRYKPAMLDGSPVKFRKFVQVNVKPTR